MCADGREMFAGDCRRPFTIMSVVEAVRVRAGLRRRWRRRGARAGRRQRHRPAFNSVSGRAAGRAHQPDGQPGAIATTSWCPAACRRRWAYPSTVCRASPAASSRWTTDVYESALDQPPQPRASPTARQLGRLAGDPVEAVELYTRQCCLGHRRDLAVMGATLADGGVNPPTRERVVDAESLPRGAGRDGDGRPVRDLGRLAVRGRAARARAASAAASSRSRRARARWATFAPPLDASGNSVKGQLVAQLPLRATRPRHLRGSAGRRR